MAVRHLRRCHNVLLPENVGDVDSFQQTLEQLENLESSASVIQQNCRNLNNIPNEVCLIGLLFLSETYLVSLLLW